MTIDRRDSIHVVPRPQPWHRRCIRILVAGLIVTVTSCANASPEQASTGPDSLRGTIRVSGSGTGLPLVERLAETFAADHPGVLFEFDPGVNSGGAIKGAAEGTIDVGIVNRSLTEAESALDVEFRPFAADAFVFAVTLPNSLSRLSSQQVQMLYGGSASNWSDVGGQSAAVILLGRDVDETATREFFDPVMAGTEPAATMSILMSAGDMVESLGSTPGGVGYTTLGLLSVTEADGVRALELDGAQPTSATIADGSYPWRFQLGMVSSRSSLSDPAGEFVEFVQSAAAAAIMQELGYALPS